ncbi:hypothetical protein HA51_19005 [Pantoea rwandensis]|uniref:Uncharacterized protein n=1 Tax=Pantoea rwandensis TaxID=1076550 RepID=A0A1X1CSX2_9GAMM|nr:hypothetical protein HA51_19005 [Pantoea rwandensis]
MINDYKTYGISGGKFGEVKGTGGTLTVQDDVFINTQLYRTEEGTEAATLSYAVNTLQCSYTLQNVTDTYTDDVPSTVIGEVHTNLYNFLFRYRGTYNVWFCTFIVNIYIYIMRNYYEN